MNDMQYRTLINLLQGLVQTWGNQYNTNIVEPLVKYVSIPQVARVYPWRKIIKPYSQTTSTDTLTYALPYDFDKFRYLKSKYGELTELSTADFHFRFPDTTDRKAQDFGFYTVEEYEGVKSQPSSAEAVKVVSSSASDTQTILVRGEVGGYDDYEEITLTGTTAVSGSKLFTHISYVSKAEATVGYVTVTGATSGTTFTIIPAEHLTAQYKRLYIDTNPQETLTLAGEYYSLVYKPVRDYDVMKVPADLVLLHALALLGWERRDVTSQLSLEKKYKDEIMMAIRYERKSHTIKSRMELANESRKVVPEDYPLSDLI